MLASACRTNRSIGLPPEEELVGRYLQRRPTPHPWPVREMAILPAGVFALSIHLGHTSICVKDHVVASMLRPVQTGGDTSGCCTRFMAFFVHAECSSRRFNICCRVESVLVRLYWFEYTPR